jgi:hypothetical protein
VLAVVARCRSLTYLQVEHARLRSVLELSLSAALLEEGVDLQYHRNRQYMHTDITWLSSRLLPANVHTSSNSSLVGVWLSERLSSMAFLNSADWATMMAVVLGVIGRLLCRFGLLERKTGVFGWESCRAKWDVSHDVICSTPVSQSVVGGPRGHAVFTDIDIDA